MSTIWSVLLSLKKKISEKEVAIQGSQSWLSFKLLPKDKEVIISLTEMLAFYLKRRQGCRQSQLLQPS